MSKKGDVYRKAAELLAEEERPLFFFSCVNIMKSTDDFSQANPHVDLYAEYFKPEDVGKVQPWFGDVQDAGAKDVRLTALLLMAEIADDE